MEDQDVLDWISKLEDEEHELLRWKSKEAPALPSERDGVRSKNIWTSAGTCFVNAG